MAHTESAFEEFIDGPTNWASRHGGQRFPETTSNTAAVPSRAHIKKWVISLRSIGHSDSFGDSDSNILRQNLS
jgi:hypothetical protein